ncbi:MAG: M48 family metalloprotease [Pseudomonadota bacterium]
MTLRHLVGMISLVVLTACNPAKADAEATDVLSETLAVDAQPDDTKPDGAAAQIEPDQYAAFRDLLLDHQAKAERVARISRQLRVANASLCERTRLDAGLSVHRLSDYPEQVRPLALHFLPLSEEGQSIRSVVPDSPGDLARLQAGEIILSGWPLRDGEPLVLSGAQGPESVYLDAEPACIAPAYVIATDRLNASTDGRDIELSTALVDQVGDDAGLALIIAHEMSHIIRGHSSEASRWSLELQADSDSLILMHNAGFDIAETVAGWEAGVEIHRDSQSFSTTHPPIDIRLKNLQTQLERIAVAPEAWIALPDTP